MAIMFRTPDGALHTVAGSDPHLKRESVAVLPTKARNGFRTKGDDADKNRIAALEAEVAVLTAKIETLQRNVSPVCAECERKKIQAQSRLKKFRNKV